MDKIEEAIKAVILSGGIVKYSWKSCIKNWFSEISINMMNNQPFLCGEPFMNLRSHYLTVDEAVAIFVRVAYGKRNLAIAYAGIRKHKLTDKDFEYLPRLDMKKLIRQYWKEYYIGDFPFAVNY